MSFAQAFRAALHTFQGYVQGFIEALPRILLAIILFWALLRAARFGKRLIAVRTRQLYSDSNLSVVLSRLTEIVGFIFAGLIALSIIFPSIDGRSLFQVLGVSSVAIGFAFKELLQNLLAGLLILLYRPFKIGDEIKVRDFSGIVEDIEMRATLVKQGDGRTVVIPNAVLYTEVVVIGRPTASQTHDSKKAA